MIYCDASVLVASLSDETHSTAAASWLRSHSPADLVASDWTVTEVGSALAFKLRLAQIDVERHRAAVIAADQIFADLTLLSVQNRHFVAAGKRHVLAPPAGLRAGDALHLAVVVDHGLSLATLDRRFAEAAAGSGVRIEPVLVAH